MSQTLRINRRDFLRLAAVGAAGTALAACAPPAQPGGETSAAPTTAPPAEEGATVTWWFAWGNLAPAIEKINASEDFKSFFGKNTLAFEGSKNREAMLAAIAAGAPPDAGSNYDYPNLFTRGAAIAVNDYVSGSSIVKQDDILEPLWQGSFVGESMIGIPSIESYLWWGHNYNADAAEKAGLDPDNPPLTWEDSFEWHKALTKFDDTGNLLTFGLDPYDAMAGEQDFAATSFGFTWWDENTNAFNLDNPLMAEAMEVCGNFIKHVGADQFQGMRAVEGNGTWGASYNAGVQNMIIEGYWHPGETQIQKPELAPFNRSTWAPVPASRVDHKIMATGPHFVQIFKDGKQPAGAFRLAEYLLTAPAMDIILAEVGWIFGSKSYLKTVNPDTYPGLRFYIEASDQVTDWIIGRRCPIHNFVGTQYTELREQVFRDLMTPQAAADEMQKRALDEWEAQGLS
jgi:maltose-binding protein MalE